MELNHIDKEHVLFIGDTLHDLDVANEMGVHCLLVSRGHHSEERLKEASSAIVGNLVDLIHVFQN